MHKWILYTITGVFLFLTAFVIYAKVHSAKLEVSWSYEYSPLPACGPERTKECIDHFEILDITDARQPRVLRTVANPKSPNIHVDSISDSFSYGPPFGRRTISVVAVAREADGSRVESDPNAAMKTVMILPSVSASLQPK